MPKPHQNLSEWAKNYRSQKSSVQEPGLNWLWILLITGLILVAVWWWWTNYGFTPKDNKEPSTVINDLKKGATKENSRLIVKPDGKVSAN